MTKKKNTNKKYAQELRYINEFITDTSNLIGNCEQLLKQVKQVRDIFIRDIVISGPIVDEKLSQASRKAILKTDDDTLKAKMNEIIIESEDELLDEALDEVMKHGKEVRDTETGEQ